jgi:hypothetical protein
MAVSPDAQKAGMTDEQWNALTEQQREEKRKTFSSGPTNPPSAVTAPVSGAMTPVPHTDTERQRMSEADRRKEVADAQPKPASAPGTIQAPTRPAAPAAQRQQTDAQRAGMTDAQWNALPEDQKIARRAQFRDPSHRTAAQRAGMTASQWNRLTPAEQTAYRLRFPDTTPEPVTTPSPPDPHNTAAMQGGSPLLQEQAATAPPLTEDERVARARRDPNSPDPGDSLEHLPNTPGGRNNPTMSNYDPSRPATE